MKNWPHFLLCLLLSASIWLIHNLAQDYAGLVTVPVMAHSALKGRAADAKEAVMVSARCSATGFKLLQLKHQRRDAQVSIHEEDLVWAGEDKYQVSAAEMAKYTSDIFGDGVTLITFLNQNYTFEFAAENYKTVPVKAVFSAYYKPQYMAAGPMKLVPDSVTVYGEADKLAAIEEVVTRSLTFNDLSKSKGGVVRLVEEPGLRMSDRDVTWSLEVVRYVELRSKVRLAVHNVPAGVAFSVYPSHAEAVFRCEFPAREDPAESCEFYVDYAEFASSHSGRCVAHCDKLPPYVIEWRLEPETFDCMVVEDAL
ncbi:MAG: YbbR-like domain-containing protein [Bacteroidales bacterium]|nr:YbbR-like domain-containing protein [Bacteroidales bacterium]